MTGWTYYDVDGKRVQATSKDAAFKGKDVRVGSDAPAPPGHASLGGYEYHDVHSIDQPELRKTFKSFSKMKAWFKDHAAKAKGKAR